MRIVLDLQGAQTESRFRGIGRYTLSLAQAIVRNRRGHEILIALNGLFPETIEPIRASFDGLLPQGNIRVWYAPGPVCEQEPGNEWRRQAAERIREAFLSSLEPDVIHVISLFEGYVDNAVTSIGVFDQRSPVVVTIHDLIPLLNPDHYLKCNLTYEHYYFRKIGHLRRATACLGVSESACIEACEALGFDQNSVINVGAAAGPEFSRNGIQPEAAESVARGLGLKQPFVLCSGGADERKNLPRLIRAYARLPHELRNRHQLVLTGRMSNDDIAALSLQAQLAGLKRHQLIFTGYIPDGDLVSLYSSCELFVFPSWHEGFGLPALEAMSCGAPVIGANTSSLPEVIGYEGALFDPFKENDITSKLGQALTDDAFRRRLIRQSEVQCKKFSWDESAKRAIKAIEHAHAQKFECLERLLPDVPRRKLAYLSPLPPERSGISDYSAELLPQLALYYDIEVILAQQELSDSWVKANLPIRSVEWFIKNSSYYDRIIYQFGNSPFHQHMFYLLSVIPGIVVLHDFFLSSALRNLELRDTRSRCWLSALYYSHGYKATRGYSQADLTDLETKYPANLIVFQQAKGVIVHSETSRSLSHYWYGDCFVDYLTKISPLRELVAKIDNTVAREALGFARDDFIVCSFGLVGFAKLNHRLLDAWMSSNLAKDRHCYLVFVGENHGGEYGHRLLEKIRNSGLADRIKITGWTVKEHFRKYLAAADVAVQLRTNTRGESSAAALDCMNYGLPMIVNANGSMAELPSDAVWRLDDEFEDVKLVEALERLWHDGNHRKALGTRAREIIRTHHSPEVCARQYAEAIEAFYRKAETDNQGLIRALTDVDDVPWDEETLRMFASCIAQNHSKRRTARILFVDVSATSHTDLKTGIERVTRALLLELIESPPSGFRVEPVNLTDEGGSWHYRYARRYTLGLFGCPQDWIDDSPIEPQPGDQLLMLDLSGHMILEAENAGVYRWLRNAGLKTYAIVYDLLPVNAPLFFPPDADRTFENWLGCVSRMADGVICISHAVAEKYIRWRKAYAGEKREGQRVSWCHLGADVNASAPTEGLPKDAKSTLSVLRIRPTFLSVGTVEPRKGYLQILRAFELLWRRGLDLNVVIIGKEGWRDLPENMRRTIPETVEVLRHHPELGRRLFWLEGVSDEYLDKVYVTSTCLIAASEGEGFGLPLIEAAQHKLPIIARDIPVFREVAGEHAYYFQGTGPAALADALQAWLKLYESGKHPRSDDMPWLTWEQSAARLKEIIFEGDWYAQVGGNEQTANSMPGHKNLQKIEAGCLDALQRHG